MIVAVGAVKTCSIILVRAVPAKVIRPATFDANFLFNFAIGVLVAEATTGAAN